MRRREWERAGGGQDWQIAEGAHKPASWHSRRGKTLQKFISLSKINLCKVFPQLLCQLVVQIPSSSVGMPMVSIVIA